jgi:hypothetical protein
MSDSPKPAQAEVNPYESPAGAGGYKVESLRGVGVWRDRDLVVMHKAARLPPICVLTGEPTTFYQPVELLRSFSTRRLWLGVPRGSAYSRRLRTWNTPDSLALVLLLAVACTLPFIRSALSPFTVRVIVATLAGAYATYYITSHFLFKCPLAIVRAQDNYFWLSGADPRFLAQLPEWEDGG